MTLTASRSPDTSIIVSIVSVTGTLQSTDRVVVCSFFSREHPPPEEQFVTSKLTGVTSERVT